MGGETFSRPDISQGITLTFPGLKEENYHKGIYSLGSTNVYDY
jgi:hypothetical protein